MSRQLLALVLSSMPSGRLVRHPEVSRPNLRAGSDTRRAKPDTSRHDGVWARIKSHPIGATNLPNR